MSPTSDQGGIMHRNLSQQPGDGSDGSPPSEAWLFAQAILGKPIPRIVSPETAARAEREELARLARFSTRHAEDLRRLQNADAKTRHDREVLEWAAKISTKAEDELRALQRTEAEEREAWRRAEQFAERLREGSWDASQHPRAPKGQPSGGQWVGKGGGSSAGSAAIPSSPFRTAVSQTGQAAAHLTAFSGAASPTWPNSGSLPSWLPKVEVRPGTDARAAAGIYFGAIAGALRNASMGAYWARMPGRQAMPYIWVSDLQKRVDAGKLSLEDAKAIFATAVLGADAQGFTPAGDRNSLVHKSALDFLRKAEAIYFARKKQKGWAVQQGGYQLSGGRVFPTKHNSGLDGYTLRQEQEKFFERGLAQGTPPDVLRGQAAEAGSKRAGGWRNPNDHLIDPEAEAALQRAIQKTKK
jgi:hypothetical protein